MVSRPALSYYGSKWRLASKIIELLPPHDCYAEPYGGSAAVLWGRHCAGFRTLKDTISALLHFP